MIDTLQKYLQQYGWTFEKVEDNVLLTGFTDADGFSYPIIISIKNDIITFMTIFQADSAAITQNTSILTLMLRLNFAWPMAKIGLDEEFKIVLAVDCMREGITYDAFAFGLDILIETAQMLVGEFSEVITET